MIYSLFDKTTGRRATSSAWTDKQAAHLGLAQARRTGSMIRPGIDPVNLEVRQLST